MLASESLFFGFSDSCWDTVFYFHLGMLWLQKLACRQLIWKFYFLDSYCSYWLVYTHLSRHSSLAYCLTRPSSGASTGTARSFCIAFSRASSRQSSHSINVRTAPSQAVYAWRITRAPSTWSSCPRITAILWLVSSMAALPAWCSVRSRAPPLIFGSIEASRATAAWSPNACENIAPTKTICPYLYFQKAHALIIRVLWCLRRAALKSTPPYVQSQLNMI